MQRDRDDMTHHRKGGGDNYSNSNSQSNDQDQSHSQSRNENELILSRPGRKCNNNNNNVRSGSGSGSGSGRIVRRSVLGDRRSSGATSNSSTITQHYYPEGGWGFVILFTATSCHTFLCGIQLSFGILMKPILHQFIFEGEDEEDFDKREREIILSSGWLGALSLGISLFFSPVWVSICKRKSTRLSAVFGGLVASLGCLFTSFASQFHQLFISYGAFIGVGVGLTRDASTLMVGQYFKRKRELVEIIVVSGSGLGIAVMSLSIHSVISSLGWRLGLQAITGSLFLTFFLSTCYRSASLYHPQRRAILHLKNQKRKANLLLIQTYTILFFFQIKEREKREDKPPLIDYSCLRSKTLQILLLSSAFTSFGIYNPLFSHATECAKPGFEGCSLVLLHIYVGASWILGSVFFGLLVIQKSQDCRVSKQYLTQVASVICEISILAFTSVKRNSGIVVFSWIYGFSLGGYNYALKVYTYERVRARHFPRAWSFVQGVQAIPLVFSVPVSNQINQTVGWKYGYLLSAITIFIGAACLFLTDVRRRRLSRRKALSQNSSMKTCETTDGTSSSPKLKQRLSFSFPVEISHHPQVQGGNSGGGGGHESDEEDDPGGGVDPSVMIDKELTCISEEGLMDIDFQDIYIDEWADYFGECITSCNKVENYLHSEYDPDYAVLVERRARRWSAARQTAPQASSESTTVIPIPIVARKGTKTTTKLLGVSMLNPKMFQQLTMASSRSQNQNSQDESSNTPGTSKTAAALGVEVVRAVPFMRNHIISPVGWPSSTPSSSGNVTNQTASVKKPITTTTAIAIEDDDEEYEDNLEDYEESM